MKDLIWWGYVGTCEPDCQGGFHGKLLGIPGPASTYRGADLDAVVDAHKEAVDNYLEACNATGRKPVTAPEPFIHAGGRDVAFQHDVRLDPHVRVLSYYSLQETFLRGRDHNQTARTMSAWCLIGKWSYRDNFDIGNEVTATLDKYGWHTCLGWD